MILHVTGTRYPSSTKENWCWFIVSSSLLSSEKLSTRTPSKTEGGHQTLQIWGHHVDSDEFPAVQQQLQGALCQPLTSELALHVDLRNNHYLRSVAEVFG
eukprot:CAMPEP_0194504224 /NCGR_PEP_ID=MMETSP0253-20130528/28825_1 /TAXON_ID=2966 /ORGANISM="Noctiluca scintillans" /LENGTH=99 /DNA_ID=CAMNT_0039346595 /DNA_START=100 /DNA_END=399 /DNA_ORIENTATION=+